MRMNANDVVARPDYGLSKRQMETLWLMACGNNNREISRELGLCENTIATYVTGLYQTLGVQDRVQAVIYALMHNLVHVEDAYAVMARRLDGVPK